MDKLLTGTAQTGEDIYTAAKAVALNGTTEYLLMDTNLGMSEVGDGLRIRIAFILSGLDSASSQTITFTVKTTDSGETAEFKSSSAAYVNSGDTTLLHVISIPAIWISSTVKYLRITVASDSSSDTSVSHQAIVYKEQITLDATSALGPGDTEVTLTIRETDGTIIESVETWVNTTNTRDGSIVVPQYTNASGEVTLNLDLDSTYYVFCRRSGYEFATSGNTISPVSGTTSFTLDLGTQVTLGDSTVYTQAFLPRMIQEVRDNLDEPGLSEKYSDAQLIVKLEQAYTHILGELNRNSQFPVVGKYTITYSSGTEEYQLPHHIGAIHAIYEEDSSECRVFYASKGLYNPHGRGIWIEGKTLHVQSGHLTSGTELIVEFVPLGTARLHVGHGSASTIVSSDKTQVTLDSTPDVGTLDRYENAYVGSVIRIVYNDAGYISEERTITSYDNTTRVATLETALTGTYSSGTLYYEICPCINEGMDHVIGLYTSQWISSIEGHTTRAAQIRKLYADAMRSIRLSVYYSKLDEAGNLHRDNYDHRRYIRKG